MNYSNSNAVAIITKYHGPTNTKCGRITANAGLGRRVTRNYDHALSTFDNHAQAALKLAMKYDWPGVYIGGGLGDGYAFITAPKYVATYSDNGIELEFYFSDAAHKQAIGRAEAQHEAQEIDSYTFGDAL